MSWVIPSYRADDALLLFEFYSCAKLYYSCTGTLLDDRITAPSSIVDAGASHSLTKCSGFAPTIVLMGFTTIVHLTLGFSISSASILANGRPSDTNSKIGWKSDVHLPIPTPNKAYNYSCRPRHIHFESIDSLPGIQRLDSLVSHPGYERILVDLKRIFFVRRKGPYPIWHSCSIARYYGMGPPSPLPQSVAYSSYITMNSRAALHRNMAWGICRRRESYIRARGQTNPIHPGPIRMVRILFHGLIRLCMPLLRS